MGRDGSKKHKVAQINPLRSGTLGCSHTSDPDARKSRGLDGAPQAVMPQGWRDRHSNVKQGRHRCHPCHKSLVFVELLAEQPLTEFTADHAAENRRHPEQPDLGKCFPTGIERRAKAARRVDRGV
jgi:hypothetical protein